MFKKTIIASAILMASTCVFAHVDYKGERPVASTAAVATMPEATYASSKGVPYVGISLGEQFRKAYGTYNGMITNIFAGYGAKVGASEKFYVGGEVFGETGSIPFSHNQYGNRATYAFGASFIPGFMLTDCTMAYGRVGVKGSHYHGTDNFNTGTQLGLGLQTALTQHWDLRGEYAYTGSGIINHFGSNGTNQINLGVLYKFI